MAHTVCLRAELEQEHQCLERLNAILRSQNSQNQFLQHVMGRSSTVQELYLQITQVAKVDVTVLVQGESGTGKELVARAYISGDEACEKNHLSV